MIYVFQVAELFLFCIITDFWSVHLLETSRQLVELESVLILLFFGQLSEN